MGAGSPYRSRLIPDENKRALSDSFLLLPIHTSFGIQQCYTLLFSKIIFVLINSGL
jgi:hypothetical protein